MTKILMRSVLTLALSVTTITAFAESQGQHANQPHGNPPAHSGVVRAKDHQVHNDKNDYSSKKNYSRESHPGNWSEHAQHRGWKAGEVLPQDYRGSRYQFLNYQQAKLGKPAKNQQWLRVNNEYVLVNVLNHQIVKVVAVR